MITSTGNAQVKQLIQLQKKAKAREERGIFLAEGIRMLKETPKERLEKLYLSESFYEKRKDELDLAGVPVEILSDQVFRHVSDTQTPQGALYLVKRSETTLEDILKQEKTPLLMVLDNLQDPGNLGTIMRTAEGADATGIILSKDCVDMYNPKVIRSTMGAIYRMPFVYVEDLPAVLAELKKCGIVTYAAHLEGQHFYDEEDFCEAAAFLIGNEGNGLREEVAQAAEKKIKIPMYGKVESLNAAVAASVLMYEACRQRRRDLTKK